MKWVVTVQEDLAGIFSTYLPIKATITWFIDASDYAPLILLKMQDPKSLTLCWRSFLGCGRARLCIRFDHWGCQYIENGLWHTDVNILQSTVTYLKATVKVKPETLNRRLEPTGRVRPGETRRLRGTGPGLTCQESAGQVFGRVWNCIDLCFGSKPGLLAGYPDPLLILAAMHQ